MSRRFVDLGTRNKGTFWSWGSAYSFSNTITPGTDYQIWEFMAFGQGEPNKHCHSVQVIEDTKELLIEEFEEGKYDEKFFNEFHNVYHRKMEDIKKRCKKDYSDSSNEHLREEIDFVAKAMFETHKPMLLALKTQYLNKLLEKELKKVIKKDEKVHEVISILLTPSKLTQVQKEQEDIIKELSKEKPDCEMLAEKHGWFHMEYMQEPWTAKNYEQLLEKIKNIPESPKKSLEEAENKRKEFFDNHPNSDKLKDLAYVLREFSYILDASKADLVEGAYYSFELFTKIARRLAITRREMLFLTLPEIKFLLYSGMKADKNLIEKRKEARIVLMEKGKINVYEGEEAKRIGTSLLAEEEEKEEVKGIVAFPGKAKGKVTKVKSVHDKDKFTEGDILVTHDGTAELTYFLKNASAIVTDQGGMICHAAIVAREIKTPCIVGTGNATKMFEDGDVIEVDAENGVARKIE